MELDASGMVGMTHHPSARCPADHGYPERAIVPVLRYLRPAGLRQARRGGTGLPVTAVPRLEAPISVVLVVHNRLDLTHACVESLRQTARRLELCVVDNGSSDETPSYFQRWSGEPALRYQRNPENVGLIRALNQGAALARGDQICFLHNDTEMLDPHWLGKLAAAVGTGREVGLAGLYGARYVHGSGTYLGRSIVHCLAEGPTMRAPAVEVAVVDGVCLFVPRAVLAEVGGFDESYGFFHGYSNTVDE